MRMKQSVYLIFIFVLTALPWPFEVCGRIGAAEFSLDSGRVILRRLQFCLHCGSALLVTRVHPGILVRCPDCGR